MKSLVLTPYCPLPADHGGKVEMMKHLDVLRSLGECTIASAGTRPVGMGWSGCRDHFMQRGFKVILRDDSEAGRTWRQWLGMFYASLCKGLRLERAFGHSSPYHRYAFAENWLMSLSLGFDLAVINYSYWSWLPTSCPKIVILHDLLSNKMWGGYTRETEDLRKADLVVVISQEEEDQLRQRGITNILYSPPLVKPGIFSMTRLVGIIGSANPFNREGLKWLSTVSPPGSLTVNIYGALSQFAAFPHVNRIASYVDPYQPYQDCGIILLPTALGTGVQIKVVEALACGRAIVARRGAMRGIPEGRGAWIEVSSPEEMWAHAEMLSNDAGYCLEQGNRAKSYYQQYLQHENIRQNLIKAYLGIAASKNVSP